MARDSEETWWEDDCCLECGDYNFHQSSVPGLCENCCVIGFVAMSNDDCDDQMIVVLGDE